MNPADGGGDLVRGPDVLDVDAPDEVEQGETFTLQTNVSSVGDEDTLRSGTPIQNISYEVFFDDDKHSIDYNRSDPDVSNRTKEQEFNDVDTTGWEIGEHDIIIEAQDASGRVTPEEDRESVTVTVEEESEITFTTLTAQSDDGGNPSPVTGTLELSTSGTVDITVFDGGENVGNETFTYDDEEKTWEVSLDSPGLRDEPLDVVAEIQDGECREGTIEERGDDGEITLEAGDWSKC